jgi:hypothetical protein
MPKQGSVVSCWLLLSVVLAALPAGAAETRNAFEELAVLVLAPVEGRAVVQAADGEIHLLAPGDALPDLEARVVQILPDRLVVEEPPARRGAPPRRVWIYRERDAAGRTRVQVLDPEAPPQPPLQKPQPPAPVSPEAAGMEVHHGR